MVRPIGLPKFMPPRRSSNKVPLAGGPQGTQVMTNMTHKSVDARRSHNRRRKELVDYIRETFNCTAKEGIAMVSKILAENNRLRQENQDFRKRLESV